MQLAFPTVEDKGMESPLFGHFGSARYFIVLDTERKTVSTLSNADANHVHGQCQPLKALGNSPVEAVVVGGIGLGALQKLNQAGIKVYRGVEGTVSENARLAEMGALPEFGSNDTCAGHHGHECHHG